MPGHQQFESWHSCSNRRLLQRRPQELATGQRHSRPAAAVAAAGWPLAVAVVPAAVAAAVVPVAVAAAVADSAGDCFVLVD